MIGFQFFEDGGLWLFMTCLSGGLSGRRVKDSDAERVFFDAAAVILTRRMWS